MLRRSLRILTYNVHSCSGLDRKTRPERIVAVIRRMRPHLVALQEVNGAHSAAHLAKSLGMSCFFAPAREAEQGAFGNAILGVLSGESVRVGRLPHLRKSLETRSAQWVRFDTEWGPLDLFNTHLGLSREERLLQIQDLLSENWLANPNVSPLSVLCGDFNALPGSAVYSQLRARFLDAQSRLRLRRATFPALMPVLRIDHVFFAPALAIERVVVPGDWLARTASDHRPLVVDVIPKED
ncbi:MAG: endonuclease/exonuclease/phosphatase family protein [Polyangiaceae bacterium]